MELNAVVLTRYPLRLEHADRQLAPTLLPKAQAVDRMAKS